MTAFSHSFKTEVVVCSPSSGNCAVPLTPPPHLARTPATIVHRRTRQAGVEPESEVMATPPSQLSRGEGCIADAPALVQGDPTRFQPFLLPSSSRTAQLQPRTGLLLQSSRKGGCRHPGSAASRTLTTGAGGHSPRGLQWTRRVQAAPQAQGPTDETCSHSWDSEG